VSIAGETRQMAVTVHATPDGKFQYDLTVGDAAPDGVETQPAGDAGSNLNLMELPADWGEAGGETDAVGLTDEDRAELTRIVREVSGLDDVAYAATIALPNGAPGWGHSAPSTAAGYYDPVADVIALADDSATRRTAFHEAFHRLQRCS